MHHPRRHTTLFTNPTPWSRESNAHISHADNVHDRQAQCCGVAVPMNHSHIPSPDPRWPSNSWEQPGVTEHLQRNLWPFPTQHWHHTSMHNTQHFIHLLAAMPAIHAIPPTSRSTTLGLIIRIALTVRNQSIPKIFDIALNLVHPCTCFILLCLLLQCCTNPCTLSPSTALTTLTDAWLLLLYLKLVANYNQQRFCIPHP